MRCGEAVHAFSRSVQPASHGTVSSSRYARLTSEEVQLSMSLPAEKTVRGGQFVSTYDGLKMPRHTHLHSRAI